MKKVILVLALGMLAMSFISCEKEEINPNLIEVMENQEYYQRVRNDQGLRVVSETGIYTLIRFVSTPNCHSQFRLGYARYNVITSDEDTFSYRARMDDRTVYQYAFRTKGSDTLNLTVYAYDEINEEHTQLEDIDYVKGEFIICN